MLQFGERENIHHRFIYQDMCADFGISPGESLSSLFYHVLHTVVLLHLSPHVARMKRRSLLFYETMLKRLIGCLFSFIEYHFNQYTEAKFVFLQVQETVVKSIKPEYQKEFQNLWVNFFAEIGRHFYVFPAVLNDRNVITLYELMVCSLDEEKKKKQRLPSCLPKNRRKVLPFRLTLPLYITQKSETKKAKNQEVSNLSSVRGERDEFTKDLDPESKTNDKDKELSKFEMCRAKQNKDPLDDEIDKHSFIQISTTNKCSCFCF